MAYAGCSRFSSIKPVLQIQKYKLLISKQRLTIPSKVTHSFNRVYRIVYIVVSVLYYNITMALTNMYVVILSAMEENTKEKISVISLSLHAFIFRGKTHVTASCDSTGKQILDYKTITLSLPSSSSLVQYEQLS